MPKIYICASQDKNTWLLSFSASKFPYLDDLEIEKIKNALRSTLKKSCNDRSYLVR